MIKQKGNTEQSTKQSLMLAPTPQAQTQKTPEAPVINNGSATLAAEEIHGYFSCKSSLEI